jgi:16S rRNA (guanine1516-N2)-methyltransferase
VHHGDRPILEMVEGRLEARWPSERPGAGITVDFSAMRFPDGPDSVRGLPLVRACGRELARDGARLVDATAGLGYDAAMLAMAGFAVTAIERVEEIAALLEDGVRRAASGRITVLRGDARAILRARAIEGRPAVVYLDPMYPAKRKSSALPPKDMQIVRAFAGDDLDSRELFDAAMAVADRVVVKRPLHAAPMREPSHSIESKLVRYDVFLPRLGLRSEEDRRHD